MILPDQSTLSYAYDDAHRLIQIQDTEGNLMRMAYDTSSQMIAMDRVNTQSQIVWRREWQYDSFGNRVQERNVRGAAPSIALNSFVPFKSLQASHPTDTLANLLAFTEVRTPSISMLPNLDVIRTTQALLKGERS